MRGRGTLHGKNTAGGYETPCAQTVLGKGSSTNPPPASVENPRAVGPQASVRKNLTHRD